MSKLVLALEIRADLLFNKGYKNTYIGSISESYGAFIEDPLFQENSNLKYDDIPLYVSNRLEIQECEMYNNSKRKNRLGNTNKISEIKIKDPEKERKKRADYRKNNKGKRNACNIRYNASKLRAIPKWVDIEHMKNIEDLYILSRKISEETGIQHHVDHIIPLRGKTVCGFHCMENLRIITSEENFRKNNRLYLDLVY